VASSSARLSRSSTGTSSLALDKALILELARLDFVRRHDDLVITGKSGTGKSHLLKAFALRACEQGLSMRYARCVDLLEDLHAGLADGTYPPSPQGLGSPRSPDHLIIDDVGLGQIKQRGDEPTAAHTLYNLVDRRHGRVSTAVTSNIGLSDWGRFSATPPSPPRSSTASPCTRSASTSTARATASTSPGAAPPTARPAF
jgi:DNA replication protein DnaC